MSLRPGDVPVTAHHQRRPRLRTHRTISRSLPTSHAILVIRLGRRYIPCDSDAADRIPLLAIKTKMNRTVENSGIYSITDLEEAATAKLPKSVAEYYNGGAMDLITYVDHLRVAYKFQERF